MPSIETSRAGGTLILRGSPLTKRFQGWLAGLGPTVHTAIRIVHARRPVGSRRLEQPTPTPGDLDLTGHLHIVLCSPRPLFAEEVLGEVGGEEEGGISVQAAREMPRSLS